MDDRDLFDFSLVGSNSSFGQVLALVLLATEANCPAFSTAMAERQDMNFLVCVLFGVAELERRIRSRHLEVQHAEKVNCGRHCGALERETRWGLAFEGETCFCKRDISVYPMGEMYICLMIKVL